MAPKQAKSEESAMPLSTINYIMIACGVVVIAATYWGMALERSVDGFFSLVVSPILLIGSYLWIIVGILYRGKSSSNAKKK
jgi:hypothetical protein